MSNTSRVCVFLTVSYNCFQTHNLSPIPPFKLFTLAPHVGTRGHSLKVANNHIQLEVRKDFSPRESSVS